VRHPWWVLAGSLAFAVCAGRAAVGAHSLGDRVAGVVGVVLFGLGVVAVASHLRRTRPRSIGAPEALPDEERGENWFPDWEAEANEFTAAELAFLDELRAAARDLPAGGVRSYAERDPRDGVVAFVALQDRRPVFRFSLWLYGGSLHGNLLDHEPVPLDGVEAAVAWIDGVLRRPVERLEWWDRREVCGVRYRFGDTGETLAERGRVPAQGDPDAVVAVRAGGRYLEPPRMTRLAMSTTGR
jgi:hypothetical protein